MLSLRAFEHLSIPLDETCISGILACVMGLKEGLLPESCGVKGEGFCQNLVELIGSSVQVAGADLTLVIVPCFVVRYFMSILVLQSS